MLRNFSAGVNRPSVLPEDDLSCFSRFLGFLSFLRYTTLLLLQLLRHAEKQFRSVPLPLVKIPFRVLSIQACSALCAILLAAGCASKGTTVVHTFASAPRNWMEISPGGERKNLSGLRVESHYLGISGTRVLMEPAGFGEFRGMVDLAVAGGAPKGFAGVFLRRDGDEHFYCFSLRPWGTGEFRYYATMDPLRPAGGSGWQLTRRNNPAGHARIGFEYAGGRVSFSLDGHRYSPSFDGILARAKSPGPWQVGLFSMDLDTRWNNFIVSDDPKLGELRDQVDWGDRSTGAVLEREFVRGADAFIDKPSRASIFTLTAALSGAQQTYRNAGADAEHAELSSRAAKLLDPLKAAAKALGEEELLVRCFAMGASSGSDRRQILGAGDTDFASLGDSSVSRGRFAEAAVYYAAAVSLESTPELVSKLAAAKKKIPVPSYSLAIDEEKVKNRVVAQSRFRTAVQKDYGGLPRQEEGDLEIRIRIKRSSATRDSEEATRRVPVIVGGEGMSAAERGELEGLEQELPEFLLDAAARAEVQRASSQLGGRKDSEGALGVFTLGSRKYELHLDDGKRALADHARLSALRAKWDGLESKLRYEEIKAERTTVSITFSAVVDLSYKGKVLVENEEIKAYRGLVLWRHEGHTDKGIEASAPSNSDIRPAAEAVRRRVLGQFAGQVSKAKLLARLDRSSRLVLLLRLARASGNAGDVLGLRWYLDKDFGLKEVLCDEVTERLLN